MRVLLFLLLCCLITDRAFSSDESDSRRVLAKDRILFVFQEAIRLENDVRADRGNPQKQLRRSSFLDLIVAPVFHEMHMLLRDRADYDVLTSLMRFVSAYDRSADESIHIALADAFSLHPLPFENVLSNFDSEPRANLVQALRTGWENSPLKKSRGSRKLEKRIADLERKYL
jgi:hypothetical protein